MLEREILFLFQISVGLPSSVNAFINVNSALIKAAHKALECIYKKDFHYKKAGVIVMNLTPEDQKQFSLFSNENPKHQPLMAIVDRLNTSYGNNKVKFGAQSLGRQWKMKQERLSPRYSTYINDIIRVKV
ncbi:DUF4113 domain-containing protein [uncultured Formosa sp.]|uniref:DUF4113 domain-containing protein n=1 Tax=uncultured Formosa sp. TaxID=255435 RepID=UPI0026072981|nr:DUF4113 domain-containing protein [uncultured Formosa sp.]